MKVWSGGCGIELEAWSHIHCRCGLSHSSSRELLIKYSFFFFFHFQFVWQKIKKNENEGAPIKWDKLNYDWSDEVHCSSCGYKSRGLERTHARTRTLTHTHTHTRVNTSQWDNDCNYILPPIYQRRYDRRGAAQAISLWLSNNYLPTAYLFAEAICLSYTAPVGPPIHNSS